MFELQSNFQPAWDQPQAIEKIIAWFEEGKNIQTLLWATGTGKTFTMANIIQKVQKPTLVISHNKTLAAQLATEFKHFFPNNAVHYFVSYFDYYQPESYLPAMWVYIEKEATINQEIEMYRLGAMASLLSREDVIVVASVSALYGLGQKRFFQENCIQFEVGKTYDFKEIKRQLLRIQYKPVQSKIEHWMFDMQWDRIDIFSSTDKDLFRLHFDEDVLEFIELRDSTSFEFHGKKEKIFIWPATQFLQDISDLEAILVKMDKEKELRVKEFEKKWMMIEAERIKKKVEYDIRMIKETWFTNGIENYSLYFDQRDPWQTPNTIFDYFPDDFMMIIDESHMTLPQLRAMPSGDKSRKENLIKYWFRLPSAIDHRPLNFSELENKLGWKENDLKWANDLSGIDLGETYAKLPEIIGKHENESSEIFRLHKNAKTIFLSATPSAYELDLSDQIAEQIIRPTWLLDPITYVYPKSWDYDILMKSVERLMDKKPHLQEFMDKYKLKDGTEEVFWDEQALNI